MSLSTTSVHLRVMRSGNSLGLRCPLVEGLQLTNTPGAWADADPVLLAVLGEFGDADGFADDEENVIHLRFADAFVDIYVRPEGEPLVRVVAVLLDPIDAPDSEDFDDPAEWREAVITRTMQSRASTDEEVSTWRDSQSDPDDSLGVAYLGAEGPRRFAPALSFEVPIDELKPGFIADYISEFASAWLNRAIATPPRMTWQST